jgi:hypothetical protein
MFPPGYTSASALFELYITGVGEYAQGGFGTSEQRQVNIVDNLSVTQAGHQLKFGVDYRWLAPFVGLFRYAQFVQFSGMTSAPGGALSGSVAFADTGAQLSNALLSRNFSLYAQDNWKMTPRLTVTYGFRWDVNPPLKGKNAANDPFTVTGLNNPSTLALAPRGTPLYQTTYGNVAPRVGLAYQLNRDPNWGTTLRAGFGIFTISARARWAASPATFPTAPSRSSPRRPRHFHSARRMRRLRPSASARPFPTWLWPTPI